MAAIQIAASDGPAEAYLSRPSGSAPLPGVLLYVDAIGLRPRIEEMADRIASWGYVVLAPHVFYRWGLADALAPKADLRAPGEREKFFVGAMQRVGGLTPDLSNADAPAWVAMLREHAAPGPIGVTGYCMGARLAIRTAALFPDDVAAVGGWHGGSLATDADDSPHRLIDGTRARTPSGMPTTTARCRRKPWPPSAGRWSRPGSSIGTRCSPGRLTATRCRTPRRTTRRRPNGTSPPSASCSRVCNGG